MEMNINSFRNQNEKNDTIMITNDNHQNCKMKNKNHYETVVQVQKVEILSRSGEIPLKNEADKRHITFFMGRAR